MPIRSSTAVWKGDLPKGSGTMRLASGAYEGSFSYGSRFENAPGTNPEELLGAAYAGCFSMALANALSKDGHLVNRIDTTAKVHLENAIITLIELETSGDISGIDQTMFEKYAQQTEKACPVGKALAATNTSLSAKLIKSATHAI